ncbi:unnamed protein product [Rhizoctonia solani]|uniref:Putative 5'-nucleotidase C-terminal domain-containing protein n=1 Tax=Rhizoctonia solani TaxID=456999 RepID=A0A8H3AR83_9AGAM|nr:unnamed protein product [Rhizoctonia solani]
MLLQSGRYFDTVGWMSVKLDNNDQDARNLEMHHRYLDNNIATYIYHAQKSHDFFTKKGKNITRFIDRMEEHEALTKVYGELPSNYYLDCKKWAKNGVDDESLFNFYLNAVETTLVNPKTSANWLFFSNWGVLRGDIYKGIFTKSDLCNPDDRSAFRYATVTRKIANKIVRKTQELIKEKAEEQERKEEEEERKDAEEERREREKERTKQRRFLGNGFRFKDIRESEPGALNIMEDTDQTYLYSESKQQIALTYGWNTQDQCEDNGNDVEHEQFDQVSFDDPEELPVFFWGKKFKEGLGKDEFVDIITTDYIGRGVVANALEKLLEEEYKGQISMKPWLSEYREDVRQNNLLEKYVESTFPYKPPVPIKSQ